MATIILSIIVLNCLILAVIGWVAQAKCTDPEDDLGNRVTRVALLAAALFMGAILLSGCSTTKALFDACRDNLCR